MSSSQRIRRDIVASNERGKDEDTKGQESGDMHAERRYKRMAGQQLSLRKDW